MPASAAAGPTAPGPTPAWNWTLGVNLMAVIWGIEIFGPLIEKHGEGGHIVSTASIAGLISGGSNAYNVTKYGVVALSEGLRLELAPRGIGVSVLCPGFIRTQILNSRRNLPERFAGAIGGQPTTGPRGRRDQDDPGTHRQGIDPALCRRAGARGHRERLALHLHRHRVRAVHRRALRRIKEGFDRIRERIPKR